LEGWVAASPIRKEFPRSQGPLDNAVLLAEFSSRVRQFHRYREETEKLRAAAAASVTLLQKNLQSVTPQPNYSRKGSGPRMLADVLAFDAKKKSTDRNFQEVLSKPGQQFESSSAKFRNAQALLRSAGSFAVFLPRLTCLILLCLRN